MIEAAYTGIKVFATVHAKNKDELGRRKAVSSILDIAEQIITLTDRPKAGTIENIEVV